MFFVNRLQLQSPVATKWTSFGADDDILSSDFTGVPISFELVHDKSKERLRATQKSKPMFFKLTILFATLVIISYGTDYT